MKTSLVAVAFAVAVSPCVLGCAEEEQQAQPAFPQAVGYTDPSTIPVPPPAPPSYAQGQPGPQGQPGQPGGGWQGPPQEVTIGGEEGDQYADTDPSALTDFRSTLDPYGSWTDDPTYGSAWVPSQSVVGSDFTPYASAGHWTYDDDYAWVSDYDWGWAPFHYGRWVYGSAAAWEWIPGRTYAGAWASWRYGAGGYVGWAPLPPTWGWRGGSAVGLGFVPSAPYTFVGTDHLFSPVLSPHLVTGGQVGVVAGNTRPYVPASAGVAGHVAATPAVGGPPPATLHIQSSSVAHATVSDRGLMQARAFSRPSTATALGARAPQQVGTRGSSVSAWSRGGASGARVPSYAASSSHFGGRLGAGFSGNVASAAPMRSPYAGSSRPYFGSSAGYGDHSSGPVRSSGGYSGSAGYHGGGYSGSGYHGGGGSSEGFHGGSSFHSGGGGGGGFHGGGGGGHGGGHR
jgi:hypothetical protein